MFKGLRSEILQLNSDVKNVANCEKAKKLRSKLLKIGIPLAVVGIIGVFICFALFAIGGMNMVNEQGTGMGVIMAPFLLIMPCFIVFCIGAIIASLGLKIVITGYATNLVEETVDNVCPNCKALIQDGADFCAKCGTKVGNVCEKCNTRNFAKDDFCKKCGNKLK